MAKDKNNLHPKKPHCTKPYDDRTSFVKQVTSRVSRLLPRGISNWLATPNSGGDEGTPIPVNPVDLALEEESDEHSAPPPPKRAREALNYVPTNDSEFSALGSRPTFAHHTHQHFQTHNFIDGSVAGPSGVTKRPQLVSSTPAFRPPSIVANPSRLPEQLTNGDTYSVQSDISISTSGCSSLVPQVKHQTETKNYSRPNRSPTLTQRSSIGERDLSSYLLTTRSIFPDNSFSPRANSSLGKGRPSFNASVFSSPLSPSAASTAIDRVPSSPFYIGRTQYGGASAQKKPRHSLFTPNEAQIPTRQSIQVKSLNSSNVSDLNSCTARRILDALDNLSSPVLDAKRIPTSPVLGNSRKRPAQDVSPTARTGGPSVQDLTIPTVPDLLKLQRRAKMQDSVEAARRIALSPGLGASSLSSTEREYKMHLGGHQAFRQMGKLTNKMKDLEEEMREDFYLPSIPLPISTLPKFDFQPSKPVVDKYSFCHPTPLDSEEFVSSNFVLSNFVSAGTSQSESSKFVSSDHSKVGSVQNVIPNSSFVQSNLKEKTSLVELSKNNGDNGKLRFGFGVAQDLKAGSVMDILGKKEDSTSVTSVAQLPTSTFGDAFKPPPGSWECTLCMLRNKVDAAKCVSCETSKVLTQPAVTSTATLSTLSQPLGFGNKFKVAPGSWECGVCMVRNKDVVTTCVSCTSPKPGAKSTVQSTLTPQYPATTGFGNQFKTPSGMWECSECMVRNKADAASCIACTTSKPVTNAKVDTVSKTSPVFGSQFKASSETWECSSCLVRNKVSVDFCIACETKKQAPPGTLNQVLIKSTIGFGDKFKKPEGSWDCPDCMLSNKDVVKCAACEAPKPGTEKESTVPSSTIKFNVSIPPEASGFKFGVDKSDVTVTKKSDAASISSFQFGSSKPPSETTGFTFGIPVTSNAVSITSPGTTRKSETFAETSTVHKSPGKPITTPTSSFSFGIPKPLNASVSTAVSEVVNGRVENSGSERKRKVLDDSSQAAAVTNVKHFATAEPVEPVKPLQDVKSTFSFGSASVPTSTMVSLNGPSKVSTSISSSVNLTPAQSSVLPALSAPSNLFSFATTKPTSMFGGFSSSTTNVVGAPSIVSASTTTQFVLPSKSSSAVFSFGSLSATTQPSSETPASGPAAKKLSLVPVAQSKEVGFNAAPSTSAPSLGTIPRFGSTAVKTEMSSFSSASVPSFGSFVSTPATTDSSAKNSALFSFGSTTDISKPTASLFSSTGKQEGSSFGSAAVPPKTASFSFGSQNVTSPPAPAPASGGFNFNVNPVPQKTTAAFSFGSSTTSSTFEAPTINSLSAAPVFGAATPSAAFGGSAVVQTTTAGFSFGTSIQPSPAVFGFGAPRANQTAASASTAFAFGQSQGSATFNPNVRPTYNFTGGDVPQFTAAVPANSAVQGRRIIKKAVRRGPR